MTTISLQFFPGELETLLRGLSHLKAKVPASTSEMDWEPLRRQISSLEEKLNSVLAPLRTNSAWDRSRSRYPSGSYDSDLEPDRGAE